MDEIDRPERSAALRRVPPLGHAGRAGAHPEQRPRGSPRACTSATGATRRGTTSTASCPATGSSTSRGSSARSRPAAGKAGSTSRSSPTTASFTDQDFEDSLWKQDPVDVVPRAGAGRASSGPRDAQEDGAGLMGRLDGRVALVTGRSARARDRPRDRARAGRRGRERRGRRRRARGDGRGARGRGRRALLPRGRLRPGPGRRARRAGRERSRPAGRRRVERGSRRLAAVHGDHRRVVRPDRRGQPDRRLQRRTGVREGDGPLGAARPDRVHVVGPRPDAVRDDGGVRRDEAGRARPLRGDGDRARPARDPGQPCRARAGCCPR